MFGLRSWRLVREPKSGFGTTHFEDFDRSKLHEQQMILRERPWFWTYRAWRLRRSWRVLLRLRIWWHSIVTLIDNIERTSLNVFRGTCRNGFVSGTANLGTRGALTPVRDQIVLLSRCETQDVDVVVECVAPQYFRRQSAKCLQGGKVEAGNSVQVLAATRRLTAF